jgi:hypothetical protein
MPLYADMYHSYLGPPPSSSIPSSLYYSSSHYNPLQYSPHIPSTSSYSRPLPSSLTNTRPSYASRYTPKLMTITETPKHANRISALSRLNSPILMRTASPKYIPQRPKRICTTEIDVSSSKYNRSQITKPKQESCTTSSIESSDKNNEDIVTKSVTGKDKDTPVIECRSTIKRDRPMVRLSTVCRRSRLDSEKETSAANKETSDDKKPDQESLQPTELEISPRTSWRQSFGDDLLVTPKKNSPKKSPGEILLEKHIINLEPSAQIQKPFQSKEEQMFKYEKAMNKRSSIRKLGQTKIPSFHEICQDISSDKIDDLNAGELRRRASSIIEEELHLVNNIVKSQSGTLYCMLEREIEVSEDDEENENNDVTSRLSRRKIKRIKKVKHKITAKVDVDNQLIVNPIIDELKVEEKSDTQNALKKINAVIESVEENMTKSKILKPIGKSKTKPCDALPLVEKTKTMQTSSEALSSDQNSKSGKKEMILEKPDVMLKTTTGLKLKKLKLDKPSRTDEQRADLDPKILKNVKNLKINTVSDKNQNLSNPLPKKKTPEENVDKKILSEILKLPEINTETENSVISKPNIIKIETEKVAEVVKKKTTKDVITDKPLKSAEKVKLVNTKSGNEVISKNTLEKKSELATDLKRTDEINEDVDNFWNIIGNRETVHFSKRRQQIESETEESRKLYEYVEKAPETTENKKILSKVEIEKKKFKEPTKSKLKLNTVRQEPKVAVITTSETILLNKNLTDGKLKVMLEPNMDEKSVTSDMTFFKPINDKNKTIFELKLTNSKAEDKTNKNLPEMKISNSNKDTKFSLINTLETKDESAQETDIKLQKSEKQTEQHPPKQKIEPKMTEKPAKTQTKEKSVMTKMKALQLNSSSLVTPPVVNKLFATSDAKKKASHGIPEMKKTDENKNSASANNKITSESSSTTTLSNLKITEENNGLVAKSSSPAVVNNKNKSIISLRFENKNKNDNILSDGVNETNKNIDSETVTKTKPPTIPTSNANTTQLTTTKVGTIDLNKEKATTSEKDAKNAMKVACKNATTNNNKTCDNDNKNNSKITVDKCDNKLNNKQNTTEGNFDSENVSDNNKTTSHGNISKFATISDLNSIESINKKKTFKTEASTSKVLNDQNTDQQKFQSSVKNLYEKSAEKKESLVIKKRLTNNSIISGSISPFSSTNSSSEWSDDMGHRSKKFDPKKKVKLNFDQMKPCYNKKTDKAPFIMIAR